MRKVENLVFKGGGVLGIAYAGAIQALQEANLLDEIKGIAGTSAGSIVATLLSLKYTASEIKEIVAATHFKKFEDNWSPPRVLTKYGLYNGDFFLSWMKKKISQKTNNENITFAELAQQGYRDLKVFATDLNSKSVKEFSKDKTPDVIVAESVRASMSIPLFFSAWKFSKGQPDDHIYVDGGTVYNYPITAFGDLSTTLGFFLYNEKTEVSDLDYEQPLNYVKALFETLLRAQDIDLEKDGLEEDVTVKIDDLGISAIDFNLTSKMEDKLFQSGLKATKTYLDAMK